MTPADRDHRDPDDRREHKAELARFYLWLEREVERVMPTATGSERKALGEMRRAARAGLR